AEPSDVVLAADGGGVVVESAAHRLIRLAPSAAGAAAPRPPPERPETELAPGAVTLDVIFEPAPGQKLDESYGPPTRLIVSASPAELLVEDAGGSTGVSRRLVLGSGGGGGVLQVVAQAATCDAEAEHAACH